MIFQLSSQNLCSCICPYSRRTFSAHLRSRYISYVLEANKHLPYPRKGFKFDPLICRPIAITSLISQTMETITTKQLLTFLKQTIVFLITSIAFEKPEQGGVSLDTSKAFDRVWHEVLLAKLPMFGLYHTLTKLIGSPSLIGRMALKSTGCSLIRI